MLTKISHFLIYLFFNEGLVLRLLLVIFKSDVIDLPDREQFATQAKEKKNQAHRNTVIKDAMQNMCCKSRKLFQK